MSNQEEKPTQTPDGYVRIQMEDGERFVVPRFVVPATHQAFDAYRVKADMNNAKGRVSLFLVLIFHGSWP